MSLMGIVLGQRQIVGIVIDTRGQVLARARGSYGADDGHSAPALSRLWPTVRETLQTLARKSERDPVTALGLCSTGGAAIGVSQDGGFIDCCLAPDEQRSEVAPGWPADVSPDDYYQITGRLPTNAGLYGRLGRQIASHTQAHRAVWRYLPLASLIGYHLGGRAVCDPTLAAAMGMYDIRDGRWSSRLLSAGRIPANRLPEVVPSGETVGQLARGRAEQVGLRPGTKVVLGGLDMACRALGAGVLATGQASLMLGSVLELLVAYQAIALMPLMRRQGIDRWPHALADVWQSRLISPRGGGMLRWFRDQLAAVEAREARSRGSDLYGALLGEMPTGMDAPLVIPPSAARTSDPLGRGAVLELGLGTTRGDIIKGMLEGTAYECLSMIERAETAGLNIDSLRVLGGGARSESWLQLLADVLGRALERTSMDRPAPLGAALLAGVSTGLFASANEGVGRIVRIASRYEPDAERAAPYVAKRARYQEAKRALGLDESRL